MPSTETAPGVDHHTDTKAQPKDTHAVVLSGGGANGAYEIGVMKALFAGRVETTNCESLEPTVFSGTSVGAYNAAYLVSQWDTYGTASIANLEQTWLDNVCGSFLKCGNGVYRIRLNPAGVINPLCYYPNPLKPFTNVTWDVTDLTWDGVQRVVNLFIAQDPPLLERIAKLMNFSSFVSSDPLAQLRHDTIDFEALRSSSRNLRIAATNWALGKVDIFTKQNMTGNLGPEIIRASAAIPGFFPVQWVGSQPFVDGGVLLNSPLQPAIEAGATVLHVITLNPEVDKIPFPSMENILETTLRQQIIGWVHAVDRNIRRIWETNRTLQLAHFAHGLLDKMLEDGHYTKDDEIFDMNSDIINKAVNKAGSLLADRFPGETIPERLTLGMAQHYLRRVIANYKPVTVYLYRPNSSLGGLLGILNFQCDRVQELIDRGFHDALNYQYTDSTYVPPYPMGFRPLPPGALGAQEPDTTQNGEPAGEP